jgi:branched-chain amino acid transport system permease protein
MPGAVEIVNSLISGVLLGGVLAMTALGLSLVLGVMRLANLAHGEFLAGGAYLGLFLLQLFHVDPLVGLVLIAAVMGVLAYQYSASCWRPYPTRGSRRR